MKIFKKGQLPKEEITQWLRDIRGHAYVPQSSYAVAAVFRARLHNVDDYYFAGVNVENEEHRISTHGEEGALAAMVTGLGKQAEIVEGWVMGAPKDAPASSDILSSCCGKCRQQIAGFASPDVKINYVALSGKTSATTVAALLPDVFTFRAFLPETGLKQAPEKQAPSCEEVKDRLARQRHVPERDIFTWLRRLEPVDYASKVQQAMVLQLDNDGFAAGVKIEEAAFCAMNAAESALAVSVSEYGLRKIEGVWLYTKGNAAHPLNLSALQTLLPAVRSHEIPVCFFDGNGNMICKTFAETVGSAI